MGLAAAGLFLHSPFTHGDGWWTENGFGDGNHVTLGLLDEDEMEDERGTWGHTIAFDSMDPGHHQPVDLDDEAEVGAVVEWIMDQSYRECLLDECTVSC